MSADRAGASVGAVRVTLLRIREGEVFHFIVPGLHMERRRPIPGEMSKHTWNEECSKQQIFFFLCAGVGVGIMQSYFLLPAKTLSKTDLHKMMPIQWVTFKPGNVFK